MNNLKTVVLGGIMAASSSLFAQDFPIKDTTQKNIFENLQAEVSPLVKEDSETEKIFRFVCGFGEKENKNKKHNVLFPLEGTTDSVLYKTMQVINKKYGNPKVTFTMSKILTEHGGYFNPFKNAIHLKYNYPEMVLVTRIAEMAHARQKQERKLNPGRVLQDIGTLIDNSGKYEEMYSIPGTIEYEAHNIIEYEITKDFIDVYIDNIDTTKMKEIDQGINIINFMCLFNKYNLPLVESLIAKKEYLKDIFESIRTKNEIALLKSKEIEREQRAKKIIELYAASKQ